MKKVCFLLSVFLFSLVSHAQIQLDGEYSIEGESSLYGKYIGKGQISQGEVVRLIKYSDFSYQNHKVEQVWSGKSIADGIEFTIKISHTLTAFNDYRPLEKDFQPISVRISAQDFLRGFTFTQHNGETLKEVWHFTGEKASGPLWINHRKLSEAFGNDSSFVRFFRKMSKIDSVIEDYRHHPEVKKYEERPEFKAKMNYIIRDTTDFDFYQNQKNVLRVTNRSVNPLSLAEAQFKKNAYGKKLSEKEELLRFETIRLNLNDAGILENAIVDENGSKIGRETEYDTALWTSMFGWAELLRYEVTKDPEALKNYRKVLDAVLTLIEISDDSKDFARGLAVSSPEEMIGEGWVQGEGKYSHLKWRRGGNNDMIKGVYMTLILAHKVVGPDEATLLKRIKKNVKTLSGLSAVSERELNLGLAQGLVGLWNHDDNQVEKFYDNTINFKNKLAALEDLESGFYFGAIADWSGINLTLTSNLCQLILAQELQKEFKDRKANQRARRLEFNAEEKLFAMNRIYKNLNRDYLTLLTWAYSEKFRKFPSHKALAQDALWGLREMPAPRHIGSVELDLKMQPDWSLSSWPRQPWKALSKFRRVIDDFDLYELRQGAYAYPLFEASAWDSTYVWKDRIYEPYHRWNGNIRTFSADYLLVYWATRASHLINEND